MKCPSSIVPPPPQWLVCVGNVCCTFPRERQRSDSVPQGLGYWSAGCHLGCLLLLSTTAGVILSYVFGPRVQKGTVTVRVPVPGYGTLYRDVQITRTLLTEHQDCRITEPYWSGCPSTTMRPHTLTSTVHSALHPSTFFRTIAPTASHTDTADRASPVP